MAGQARVTLFGSISLGIGTHPVVIRFRSAAVAQLLAFLALHQGNRCSRAFLAEMMWPEHDLDKALENLRSAWYHLRKATEPADPKVVFGSDSQAMWLLPGVEVDWQAFCSSCAQAQQAGTSTGTPPELVETITEALKEFLPGCPESWAGAYRLELEQKVAGLLAIALTDSRLHLGVGQRLDLAYTVLTRYRKSETVVSSVITALLKLGHNSEALKVFEEYEEYLQEEWGEPPPPSVLAALQTPLELNIRALEVGITPPSNEAVELLGREQLVNEVLTQLKERHAAQVLTITGEIGVGKSTFLSAIRNRLPVGRRVVSVALGTISDPRDAIAEVARNLLVSAPDRESGWGPVARSLNAVPTVLCLDNAEHLLPGIAPLIQELQAETQRVQIVISSRVPLGVTNEWVVELQLFPHVSQTDSIASIVASPDFRLFVQEATLALGTWSMTVTDLANCVNVCAALRGHALSLVLAAASLKNATLQEVARLVSGNLMASRFDLSPGVSSQVSGPLELISRTFSHLQEDTLHVLLASSLFSGSFDEEDAAIASGVEDIAEAILDLTQRRLIWEGTEDDRPTYSIHFGVREAARLRLIESGESGQVKRRIVSGYAQRAQDIYPKLQGHEFPTVHRWVLQHELALLDAVSFAASISDLVSVGQEMVFHLTTSIIASPRARLWWEKVASLLKNCPPSEMTREAALAHWTNAQLGMLVTIDPADRIGYTTARQFFVESGDHGNALATQAYELLGMVINGPTAKKNAPTVLPRLYTLLEEVQATDDLGDFKRHVVETSLLSNLAATHRLLGQNSEAVKHLELALQIAEHHQFERALPILLAGLSDNLLDLGETERAYGYISQAYELATRNGQDHYVHASAFTLSRLLILRGSIEIALPFVSRSLRRNIELAEPANMASALLLGAGILKVQGHLDLAVRMTLTAAQLEPTEVSWIVVRYPSLLPIDALSREQVPSGAATDEMMDRAVALAQAYLSHTNT